MRLRAAAIGLFAGAATIGVAEALANPRASSTLQTRTVRTVSQAPAQPDVEAWLRRRVGRFRIEGSWSQLTNPNEPIAGISGMADCVGVGAGPGIECIVVVDGEARLLTYGFDPGDLRIHYMEVNSRGIVEGGSGVLKGNSLVHRTKIANTEVRPYMERITRTWISPEGEISQQIDIELDFRTIMQLHLYYRRIAQVPAGDSPVSLP